MSAVGEQAGLVALLRSGERAWERYASLVEDAGSALAVLDAEVAEQATLFGASPDLAAIEAEILGWEAEGMRLVTVLDPGYPANLRSVHDRPPLVFISGRLTPQDARSIAVVGARDASTKGTGTAERVAAHLVDAGYTVLSGLASGIDTAVHVAALARGGRTVAVIGTGLRRSYPPQNAALQRQIAAQCAVISQFWPDAPPSKRSFPLRNGVMSGIALATVVVEASVSSGSRIQARLALGHGRPLFLLKSLLNQEWARELAARPGVYVVDTPAAITDVVERLTSKATLIA